MTPEQKLKHMVLIRAADFAGEPPPEGVTAETVDAMYEAAYEADDDSLQDARYEVRASGIETGLETPHSRHYEAKAVAAQAPDGTWVGWTYWYGGGKHGEPESIDWMDDAYDLTCVEQENTVVVREFTKA